MDGEPDTVRAIGRCSSSETWREYSVDANNDGVLVDNIDDAALSAAGYSVGAGRISPPREGGRTALWAYNDSDVYAGRARLGHRLCGGHAPKSGGSAVTLTTQEN